MRVLLVLCVGAALLPGCLPEQWLNPAPNESDVVLVPSSPFSAPGPVTSSISKVNYNAGDKQTALYVGRIGQQLVTANPEMAMRPKFAVYGTPNTELFHSGTHVVHITEGLVKKALSDGQLAALLAHELAEMVVEREALANPKMRAGDAHPPEQVIIGNGVSGQELGEMRLAELAKFEKRTKQEQAQPIALPDPEKLARRYLEKAGYNVNDLDTVQPLLKEAERTYVLEKQIKQTGVNWAPAKNPQTSTPPASPAVNVPPSGNPPANVPPQNTPQPGLTLPAAGKADLQLPATLPDETNGKAPPTLAPVPVWPNGAN